MKIVPIGRNLLKKDTVIHTFAFRKDAIHRQGREHPVLNGIFFKNFLVVDIISEAILLVALDDDTKHIQNGIAMTIEGTSGNRRSFAHIGIKPMLVDFT